MVYLFGVVFFVWGFAGFFVCFLLLFFAFLFLFFFGGRGVYKNYK